MSERVEVHCDGPVRTLVINRPGRSNALTPELAHELRSAIEACNAADSRVLVLTGAGWRAFCGGFDLNRVGGLSASAASLHPEGARTGLPELMASIEQSPVPVVAALNGHAVGAGLELACRCDLRVVRRGARIGLPAVRLGVAYRADGVAAMLAAAPSLRRLLLTGLPAPVEEVADFADLIVDVEQFGEQVAGLAADIATGAPRATSYLVRVMRRVRAGGLDGAAFDEEMNRIMAGPDLDEALRARLERAEPSFAARFVPPDRSAAPFEERR